MRCCREPLRRGITGSFIRPLEKALPEFSDSSSATSAGTERGSDIVPNLNDSLSSSESRGHASWPEFSETLSIRSHSPRRSPTPEFRGQSDHQVSERPLQDQCGRLKAPSTDGAEPCLAANQSATKTENYVFAGRKYEYTHSFLWYRRF